jgi:RNA polymerase sigma-70 factor (ECF subfamily)
MSADEGFRVLIRRVRAGDQDAAAALVRQYEPQIRRVVRMRLTDPRLRQVLDSSDICQSVLANVFIRAAAGQFELERPEQLLRLLATMARNRVLSHVQHQHADRRDSRRVVPSGQQAVEGVPGHDPSPSQFVANKDLLQEVYRQFSAGERYLAEQRAAGRDWAEIAAEIGSTAEALRKKLARALDRVARQLGLEGAIHT